MPTNCDHDCHMLHHCTRNTFVIGPFLGYTRCLHFLAIFGEALLEGYFKMGLCGEAEKLFMFLNEWKIKS